VDSPLLQSSCRFIRRLSESNTLCLECENGLFTLMTSHAIYLFFYRWSAGMSALLAILPLPYLFLVPFPDLRKIAHATQFLVNIFAFLSNFHASTHFLAVIRISTLLITVGGSMLALDLTWNYGLEKHFGSQSQSQLLMIVGYILETWSVYNIVGGQREQAMPNSRQMKEMGQD
jgi:hypothetical protein